MEPRFRSACTDIPPRRVEMLGVPLVILLLVFAIAACTQTKTLHAIGEVEAQATPARILLMPPDVELFELTAGGALEPNAQWTSEGKTHVGAAVTEEMRARNADPLEYQVPRDQPSKEYEHNQLVKLHEAVGSAILWHKYGAVELPTKKDTFDWTLGKEAAALSEDFDADYALFVFLRDSYSSSGRVALQVFAAVFGVGVSGGAQVGFASLVDLRTGDVLWFNTLTSTTGDLRTAEPAREAAKQLLAEFPI